MQLLNLTHSKNRYSYTNNGFCGKTVDSSTVSVENLLEQVDKKNLKEHVDYLASEHLAGRLPGTQGSQMAQSYITKQFKDVFLKPCLLFTSHDYKQTVFFGIVYQERLPGDELIMPLNKAKDSIGAILPKNYPVVNLLSFIPAATKSDKYVFLTAHYDHIGRDTDTGKVYPGADDNASGVSAMLEIARIMSDKKFNKNIVFVATSGEETGCLGAKYLARELVRQGMQDKSEIINIDCLGATGDFATVEGSGNPKNGLLVSKFIDNAKKLGIQYFDKPKIERCDAEAFQQKDIPVISLAWAYRPNWGNRIHLHQPSDKPEKIDYNNLEKATKLTLATLYNVANE